MQLLEVEIQYCKDVIKSIMSFVCYRVLRFTDCRDIFQLSFLAGWFQCMIDIVGETLEKLSVVDVEILQVFERNEFLRWLIETEVVLEERYEMLCNRLHITVNVLMRYEHQNRHNCSIAVLEKSLVNNV